MQLGHVFDSSNYTKYAFAGGGSAVYRKHLAAVAVDLELRVGRKNARILEIGCGDGALLHMLRERGFSEVFGIDPGRAAQRGSDKCIACGFFPADLPDAWLGKGFDVIVVRHVLEHIENPVSFVRAIASVLRVDGLICVEVPDLDSTLRRGIWSNFYQLHCNYFSAVTLDRLLDSSDFAFGDGRTVEIFGGSLLRFYRHGRAVISPPSERIDAVSDRILGFRSELDELALKLPLSAAGYGAAERTATTLGLSPELSDRLSQLHDGNPLLHGRFLAGTRLRIRSRDELYANPPLAIVLFAISNAAEIIGDFRRHLPGSTLIGIAGNGPALTRLEEISS